MRRANVLLAVAVALVALIGSVAFGAEAPSYKDGSYIGYVPDDHGDVVIEVVIQFGKIVDVNMINPDKPQSYKHEAAKALFREYPLMVVKNQKADIDAVSGATSSRNQYTKATQMALDIASGKYKGNVFYGLAKNPVNGHTLLAVTVQGKKVTKVEFITKKTDYDTLMAAKGADYKSKPAKEFFDSFPQLAVKVQTDLKKIDAVSGATHSYHEYLHAYENALRQAGLL
ncbi:MAG: FMN-binding protein [Firmicutes bacterium]|nr:FMN-binding protein [Bacillota bacterium]MDH7494467.1 FMN-binding protein [Bacillota bacterium]